MKHHISTAKSLQSCPTLCDPIDGSPPGSPVPGILQATTLEWVAISFSNAWKWKVKGKLLSRIQPSATPWTAAFQAPPSMGFSRQEYWSGVPLPSLGITSNLHFQRIFSCSWEKTKKEESRKYCCIQPGWDKNSTKQISAFIVTFLLFLKKKSFFTFFLISWVWQLKFFTCKSHRLRCLVLLLFSCSVVSDSLQPHAHQAPLSMRFPRQEYQSESWVKIMTFLIFLSIINIIVLLLLLLSHFSCVWLCATPEMAAHQAPLSLGFSRQEHWNGLPFCTILSYM